MEFDKSKVFTPFNCDEVKIGSKGYFSDHKETLISRVQLEDKDCYGVLKNVCDNADCAFLLDNNARYCYFYLVEEPKEKAKRPCTREELIEMLKEKGLPMLKWSDDSICLVDNLSKECCRVQDILYTYSELCEECTLLDGTELWVKE